MQTHFYIEFLPIYTDEEHKTVKRLLAVTLHTQLPEEKNRRGGTKLVRVELDAPLDWFDTPIVSARTTERVKSITGVKENLEAIRARLVDDDES